MGSKLLNSKTKGDLGPGPGGYKADKLRQHNYSYSMGGKLDDIEFNHHSKYKPGPGNYENLPANSIPSMKFGSGKRIDL